MSLHEATLSNNAMVDPTTGLTYFVTTAEGALTQYHEGEKLLYYTI